MINKFTRSSSRKKQSSSVTSPSSSSVTSSSNAAGGGGGHHTSGSSTSSRSRATAQSMPRSSSGASTSSPRRSHPTSRSTPGPGLNEHLSRDGGGGGGGGGSSRRNNKSSHPSCSASVASSTGGASRRFSSALSVASISSASVFAPSVAPSTAGGGGGVNGRGGVGGLTELQPSSARLLKELNKSANSSLLSSLGTAASRTFRSYKMTLPRFPPVIRSDYNDSTFIDGGGGGGENDDGNDDVDKPPPPAPPVETDLELLGRTVHAVSSALTEPPRDGDRYMIYDVGFNPRGCVWDALVVVQVEKNDDDDLSSSVDGSSRSSMRGSTNREGKKNGGGGSRRRGSSTGIRRSTGGSDNNVTTGMKDGSGGGGGMSTFTFPIRVTCAEDEDDDASSASSGRQQPQRPRAKTYAVDVSVIDDSVNYSISRWSAAEALERRDDMKNAMEWVSYGIRRSMARSMFPKFPEGCQGRPFREIYQLNKKLKSGTFSTVCRGVHRVTGRQVAVKCILRKKIEPSVDAAVFEEVLIMSGLHHKYICPMIDYFEEDRCHFVVMELERGGDLCERLNEKVRYSEEDARKVVRNICEAMDFVHSRGFAHCDIKPRNYLLRSKKDDVDVRLADFGFAQHVHAPNCLTSQCGTPFFVAPEVINRKPYDQKVDMWSIGVTTYLLLCGETPFNGKNRQQLFRRISCDEPTFADDKWGSISDEGVDFIRKLLAKDPAKRLSAAQALSHRWLRRNEEVPTNAQPHRSSIQSQSKLLSQPPLDLGPSDKWTRGSSSSVAGSVSSTTRSGGFVPPSHRSREPKTSVGSSSSVVAPMGSKAPSRNQVLRSSVDSAKSREPTNRISNNSESRERTHRSESKSGESSSKSKAGESSSKSKPRDNRSISRERSRIPPPPPRDSSSIAADIMKDSSSADINARLLDVIKSQDAKIEQLERLVKRMLDPEGAAHDK